MKNELDPRNGSEKWKFSQMAVKLWGSKTPGNAQDTRDLNLLKNKKKVIKMLVIVVVLFCVAWFPLQLYNVLQVNINVDLLSFLLHSRTDKTNVEGEKGLAISQFIYLFVLLFLRYVLQVTWPEVNEYPHIHIIWLCCDWLAMSNSCYNPFIYGIYNVSRQKWQVTLSPGDTRLANMKLSLELGGTYHRR